MRLTLTALASCVLLARALPAPPALTDVFTAGRDGYACYRIPALITLTNGSLLLFAEGRLHSCADHGYVDLVMKRSEDGGATWSALRLVRSESTATSNITIGNPAPVALPHNQVLLPFCRNNREAALLHSADGGGSWVLRGALPVEPAWTWVATGPPGSLLLPSGRILVPANRIAGGQDAGFAYLSDDAGATWAASSLVPQGNECQAAALPWVSPSTVLLSLRNAGSSGSTSRLAALSSDAGATWGAPWETLHETECQASTLALRAATASPLLLMSSAFASTRTNLTLHVSSDAGRHWAPAMLVYAGSAAYSTLAPSGASATAVHLAFERDGYSRISLAGIDTAQLQV